MTTRISAEMITSDFVARIQYLSGQDLMACYQCGKCAAGCPVATHMDVLPNQIVRFAQLGFFEELLTCKAIWLCVSCLTCNSRCPKGIRIAEIIEAVRQILLRKRHDHLQVDAIPARVLETIPPIALISSMRKFTS